MKTIHPLKLESLLEASQPVEIVDIRPRTEFEKVHIEGAHSIPSAEISAETLVCTRELLQTEPIYLVSESGALAQLQACDLERQGLDNVVNVSGGMRRWQSDGSPVAHASPGRRLARGTARTNLCGLACKTRPRRPSWVT
jgi:rhodanese-related sulfurtransferase